jgi:hypothetical protein
MPWLAQYVTNNCHFSKLFGGDGNLRYELDSIPPKN